MAVDALGPFHRGFYFQIRLKNPFCYDHSNRNHHWKSLLISQQHSIAAVSSVQFRSDHGTCYQQIFGHDTAAQISAYPSCHVYSFVAITVLESK